MSVSPFFAGFSATSFEENKNRIVELDWSADGQQFSFRIDPTRSPESHNDIGVWFWQPELGPLNTYNYMLIRDCPAEHYGSCQPGSANGTALALEDERSRVVAYTRQQCGIGAG